MKQARKALSLPFVDRPPTDCEVEKIGLILSTYQDGTGMLRLKDGTNLPGWRDFERSVAFALDGITLESKAVFDVILSRSDDRTSKFGLSCKMRRELGRIERDGRVNIEASNSSGAFWDHLAAVGIVP